MEFGCHGMEFGCQEFGCQEDVKKSVFSFRVIFSWKNIAPGCVLSDC
jgi:hypothetical protein